MTFAHLALATRDPEASAAFYESVLRWRRLPLPTNVADTVPVPVVWLEVAPGQSIHLIGSPQFEPSPFEVEFGRHHAFLHPGSDFDALKRRLAAAAVPLIPPIRPTPFERIFFRDPNGYLFELIHGDQWTPESPS